MADMNIITPDSLDPLGGGEGKYESRISGWAYDLALMGKLAIRIAELRLLSEENPRQLQILVAAIYEHFRVFRQLATREERKYISDERERLTSEAVRFQQSFYAAKGKIDLNGTQYRRLVRDIDNWYDDILAIKHRANLMFPTDKKLDNFERIGNALGVNANELREHAEPETPVSD